MGALLFAGLLLLGTAGSALGARELTDAELDRVRGGEVSVDVLDGVLQFQFRRGADHRTVEGSGTIALRADQLPRSVGTLMLRDSAQGNLRSLVNINAVNSAVQVLINLNVNINSSVGTLRQINFSRGF